MKYNSFFNYDELTDFLKKITSEYPDLFSLNSLAKTDGGRDLWCLEVTDRKSGIPNKYKSGFFIQGNLHAIEFAGSMQCIYFINYLIENYNSDIKLKRILKERIFYIIPRVAVDGCEHILNTLNGVRSKHSDNPNKNVMKKKDINGDGKILTMRWKSSNGQYKVSDKDSRLMVHKNELDKETDSCYMLSVEGILNQDREETELNRIGLNYGEDELDFNRNFPVNWNLLPNGKSGRYPLSEIETRAITDFIIDHPNIIQAMDFHTGNTAVFYPATVIKNKEKYQPDVDIIKKIGSIGEKITGFKLLSGYIEEKTGQYDEPIPGCFLEWLYEDCGIIGYIVEMGLLYNYLGVPRWSHYSSAEEQDQVTGEALLKWHDEHPDENLFFDWTPFIHPQLGEVEIGGWNWMMWSNPPLDEIGSICKKCTEFILECCEWIPKLSIKNANVEKLGGNLYKLSVLVNDSGPINLNILQKRKEKNPSNTYLTMDSDADLTFIIGSKKVKVGDLLRDRNTSKAEWVIKTEAKYIVIEICSECGIYYKKRVCLQE